MNPVYSPWAALACTLVVLLLMSTPLFRAADAPPNGGGRRVRSIDGLRGFSAFGVFLHHALITRDYLADGVWRLPPSRFYSLIGQVGVAVFFMVTGYLFWSKLLRERGRPHWFALYVGRVLRIGPVYALSIAVLTVIVFSNNGWALAEEPWEIVREVMRWLSLGILSGTPIDGDGATGIVLAGVTWSLQYEWAFYAALPALAIGALHERWALPFAVGLLVAASAWRLADGPSWLGPNDAVFALLFAGGMTCASLEAGGLLLRSDAALLSAGVVATLGATFALFPFAYAFLPALVLGTAFFLVVSGGDLFGLLRSRTAQRLGNISFGAYMLQGPVLFVAYAPPVVRTQALASPLVYWMVVFAAAVALMGLATLAHHWVERPGIRAGQKIVDAIVSSERHRQA